MLLDAKNKAMVTLIVVDSLFFSDRYLDRAFFKDSYIYFFLCCNQFCSWCENCTTATLAKYYPWDITPRDFSEEKRTDIDIVVIYRRLKLNDDFEFNH